jgi:mannose-6-phosphate isomerase-like protein (cupin superfamily)
MTRTLASTVALLLTSGFIAGAADSLAAHIPADRTAAAFAKGQPLVETGAYKVHASRRDAPGKAEIHDADTDVIYVLDGTATIVTGGRAVGAAETAPGERRGDAIDGGVAQRLVKGDVFIVPNGVPHQFTEVGGPLLYYVVKVTAHGTTEAGR